MNFLSGVIAEIEPKRVSIQLNNKSLVSLSISPDGFRKGERVEFGFRPEHLSITSPEKGNLRATVTAVEQLGGESYIYCKMTESERLTLHLQGQTDLCRNDVIGLKTDEDRSHIFHSDSGLAGKKPIH
jgi:ABC-type sugar transport system ATPase subunit